MRATAQKNPAPGSVRGRALIARPGEAPCLPGSLCPRSGVQAALRVSLRRLPLAPLLCRSKPAPAALVDYLKGAKAKAIIKSYGYEMP